MPLAARPQAASQFMRRASRPNELAIGSLLVWALSTGWQGLAWRVLVPGAVNEVEQLPVMVFPGAGRHLVSRRSPILTRSSANHRADVYDVGERPVYHLPWQVQRA